MRKLLHFIRHHAVRFSNLSHTTPAGIRIDIKTEMERRIHEDIFGDGDYDEAILKAIHWPRRHEDTKERHDEVVDKPLIVLDLGSNVLFFAFRVIHLALERNDIDAITIHCIEGSKTLIGESQKRIDHSTFSKERFKINLHQGLIGQPEGNSVFYHFKDHGLSSVFRKDGTPERLSFINVSNLVKNYRQIDLLKCDIEGSEAEFIKNYSDLLEKTNVAIFEFHTEYCDYEDCAQTVQKAGLVHHKTIRQSHYSRIELFWR